MSIYTHRGATIYIQLLRTGITGTVRLRLSLGRCHAEGSFPVRVILEQLALQAVLGHKSRLVSLAPIVVQLETPDKTTGGLRESDPLGTLLGPPGGPNTLCLGPKTRDFGVVIGGPKRVFGGSQMADLAILGDLP